MSKSLSKIKIYSLIDFNKATKLEKIYMHLMQPHDFELTYEEDEYLQKLRESFCFLSENPSKMQAILKLQELYPGQKKESVYRIINDCQEIFGNIIQSNKSFDRMIIKERLLAIADKLKDSTDAIALDVARKCYADIAKIEALDKHGAEGLTPEEMKLPDLFFTDDPKYLNAEEIESEEV
jgi:hypothetical protein